MQLKSLENIQFSSLHKMDTNNGHYFEICEYCIYLIKRPGRLLNIWTFRVGRLFKVGAYWTLGAY